MAEKPNNKFFNRTALICSSGAVFVAFLGLLGWIPSLSFLGNISPHFIPMAPTASLCFILLGLIVLIHTRYRLQGWSRYSAIAVTCLISVFAMIEFAEYFHTGIDIEDFIIPNVGMLGLMRKARMSPATGATFFISGLAALLILFGKNNNKQVKVVCSWSGIVGGLVTITGITIIMGYLYGDPLLYGSETIPMAATTAIGFIFLGVGLVAAVGPDHMPVRLLVGHSSRVKLLRVFLPLSVLIVLSQDILHRFVFVPYQINSALVSVLLLMVFVAITGVIVTVMAGVIGRALDTAEKQIESLAKFPEEDPNPVLRITKEGEVLYSNEAGKLLLAKWDSGVGEKVPEKWRNLIAEAFTSENGTEEEVVVVRGKVYSLAIAPIKETGYANLYARDITERKQAEAESFDAQQRLIDQQQHETEHVEAELSRVRHELVQSTRLAAIGQVSGSIAHDLRNPLGTIRNAAYLLNRHLSKDESKLLDYTEIINHEVARADQIITNLLEMVGPKVPRKRPVDLGQIIREVEQTQMSEGVACQISAVPDPFVVQADKGQLRQVIDNILSNSVYAMGGQGIIFVEASRDSDYDTIVFRDTGTGFAPEVRDRLFDALVTTKASGIGLGLTICHQIVEKHGGTIEADEHNQQGAVIRIRLPRS